MKIEVRNVCPDFDSYRAARVKSMFNAESGCNFSLDAELPIESGDWRIGVIVGPSGSGKTSIGRKIWPDIGIYNCEAGWHSDRPIIDDIAPSSCLDDVTAALAAVGLGSVPSWLRPYAVLSNGEKFRAALARVVAEKPGRVIFDEFTSVVDRQIAKVGAAAFGKAFRRTGGRAVILSCHYDILDWLEPDWVFDTRTGTLERGCLRRRPEIKLEIWQTNGSYWKLFEPHHYLKAPHPIAAKYYVGFIDGEPVCHLATSPKLQTSGMRICRLVVMPEWQGLGLGVKFLNSVARMQFTPINKHYERTSRVYISTSHPGLCACLRRDPAWVLVDQITGGSDGRSRRAAAPSLQAGYVPSYGGHLRALQSFVLSRQNIYLQNIK